MDGAIAPLPLSLLVFHLRHPLNSNPDPFTPPRPLPTQTRTVQGGGSEIYFAEQRREVGDSKFPVPLSSEYGTCTTVKARFGPDL